MTSARLRHLALWIAATGGWLWQTGRLQAEGQTAIASRLNEMLAVNSIDAVSLNPWHLKMSYTLVDDKGAASDQGTVEEWWAAPKLHHTVYTGAKYTATELMSESGEYFEGDLAAVPSPVPGRWRRISRARS